MKKIISPVVAVSMALFMAACGAAPSQSPSSASSLNSGARTQTATDGSALSEQELGILANPSCGVADGEFGQVIIEIMAKYGRVIGEEEPTADHHTQKSDISLQVCDDSSIYAYSYSKTVVIHSGLLKALKNAAQADELEKMYQDELLASALAFVIYHEFAHIRMGDNIYEIGQDRIDYRFDSAPEIRADSFAAGMVLATGYSMDGIDLVFSLLNRVNPGRSVGHPPPWERLERVRNMKPPNHGSS